MATIQTHPWDAAEHLETKQDIAAPLLKFNGPRSP